MRRDYLIIAVLLIIIVIFGVLIITHAPSDNDSFVGDSSPIRETLANYSDDPGTVEVIKGIGNSNSDKKIAYVVGLHPLEHLTHETLVKLLPKMSNLNYHYDIYIINVTEDIGSYDEDYSDQNNPGRENGQKLAYQYVYPEIINGDYDLAIDVHSNIGAYPYKTFVFSPVGESISADYAKSISVACENITYYDPESTTSGPYLTIPLNENGVPAFYYEEYSFASQDIKDSHMLELISAVDNLSFIE